MSKHSIRSGGVSSSSASWISSRARFRVDKSPARVVLCLTSVSPALRATVSISDRLSPRCGTRMATCERRGARDSIWVSDSYDEGSVGTRISRGTASRSPVVGSASTSAYSWSRNCSTSTSLPESSKRSATQPRWPRTRPPRTWKICTATSSGSSARAITSASVPSCSTTAFCSIARRNAPTSSRSLAARSNSSASLAARISRSSLLIIGAAWPPTKEQKSSTIARWLSPRRSGRRTAPNTCRCSRAGRAGRAACGS